MLEINKIHQIDALEGLKQLDDNSIDCSMSSPPYWAFRDYSTEGQLGLEPTFDEYITKLCNIYDEVRRVLKPTGTCWINLGDTYGGSGNGQTYNLEAEWTKKSLNKGTMKSGIGVKQQDKSIQSKSLTLIPFRFAIEMTKRRGFIIPDEKDRAWLAGIIEGEGCIHIHKRKTNRKNPTYGLYLSIHGLYLSIHNTDKKMIDRVVQLTKQDGNIQTTEKDRNKKLYRWNAMSDNAKKVLREVYPYLVTKREQARCALFCPSSGDIAEECFQNIKKLHNQQEPTRDYKEPEVGGIDPWILRNVIIWRKPNCMPSSAKDRFTVDFEYVFFFVKNKKYFFESQYDEVQQSSIERMGRKWVGSKHKRLGVLNNLQQVIDPEERMDKDRWLPEQGRNKRTVWSICPQPFPEAHFAVYPEELCQTPIKSGCPKFVCKKCGKASYPIFEPTEEYQKLLRNQGKGWSSERRKEAIKIGNALTGGSRHDITADYKKIGYKPSCNCNADFEGGTVLDPFMGAGTTAIVALKQSKRFIGFEINPEYISIANKRIKPYLEQTKLTEVLT